ncbi:hypothetical protein OV450_4373 [Actinobacteria bacterium OV450]|nr:hypothetical protein OV450_4373 [Actinobacteria bacterium OV450]
MRRPRSRRVGLLEALLVKSPVAHSDVDATRALFCTTSATGSPLPPTGSSPSAAGLPLPMSCCCLVATRSSRSGSDRQATGLISRSPSPASRLRSGGARGKGTDDHAAARRALGRVVLPADRPERVVIQFVEWAAVPEGAAMIGITPIAETSPRSRTPDARSGRSGSGQFGTQHLDRDDAAGAERPRALCQPGAGLDGDPRGPRRHLRRAHRGGRRRADPRSAAGPARSGPCARDGRGAPRLAVWTAWSRCPAAKGTCVLPWARVRVHGSTGGRDGPVSPTARPRAR